MDAQDKTSKEYKVAERNFQRYVRAKDAGHEEYLKTSRKCERYYKGDQWDQKDLDALEAAGRPALTVNKVLSTVNTLLGEQSTRRASFQAKVRKDGSNDIATVISKTMLQVAEANDLGFVESAVFREGVITGRGFFDVRITQDGNINGEISITRKKASEVLIDPDASEYDPRTWKEVITTSWLSLDDIENQFEDGKKKVKELRDVADLRSHFGDDSLRFDSPRKDTFGGEQGEYYDEVDPTEQKDVRSVRVISRQYKKMKVCRFFVDQGTGDTRRVPENWGERRVAFAQQMYGLSLINRPEQAIRWTTTADSVVLHDAWSPYRTFTIIPYFCYWSDGSPFGVVQNLLSPQDQLNKVVSQELHIVNSTANGGWIMEEDSLSNMSADDLAEQGSKTGIVLEVKRSAKMAPDKIKPNQIPTGLERISVNTAQNIKEISGVSDAMLGLESAEVSGVALKTKEGRGQIQIQVPLDNLAYTRLLMGRKLLELIQTFYKEERLLYITRDDEPHAPREELAINQVTPEGTIINDITVGEYDIVVTTQPARDAFNDTQFAELLNMRQVGINVPAYRVIQNSHLAKKDEIAEEMRNLEGLGQPSPEQEQMQQLQMQVQMQQMQLTLQELAGKVEKLGSETRLNHARATDIENSDEMEMRQLEYGMAKEREGNDLRRDLSEKSAIAGIDKQVLSTKGRIAEKYADAALKPRENNRKENGNGN